VTHTQKLLHKKTALRLAWWRQQVETHTRSLSGIYLPFTWRASLQCCQIVRYTGSLINLFTDHICCFHSTYSYFPTICEYFHFFLYLSSHCGFDVRNFMFAASKHFLSPFSVSMSHFCI